MVLRSAARHKFLQSGSVRSEQPFAVEGVLCQFTVWSVLETGLLRKGRRTVRSEQPLQLRCVLWQSPRPAWYVYQSLPGVFREEGLGVAVQVAVQVAGLDRSSLKKKQDQC